MAAETLVLGVGGLITVTNNGSNFVRATFPYLIQHDVSGYTYLMLVDGVGSTDALITATGTDGDGNTYFDINVAFGDGIWITGIYCAPTLLSNPSYQYTTVAQVEAAGADTNVPQVWPEITAAMGAIWLWAQLVKNMEWLGMLPNQYCGFQGGGTMQHRATTSGTARFDNLEFRGTGIVRFGNYSAGAITQSAYINRCRFEMGSNVYIDNGSGATQTCYFTSNYVRCTASNAASIAGAQLGTLVIRMYGNTFDSRYVGAAGAPVDGIKIGGNAGVTGHFYNNLMLGRRSWNKSLYRASSIDNGDYNCTEDATADELSGSTHNVINFDVDTMMTSYPFNTPFERYAIDADSPLYNAGIDATAYAARDIAYNLLGAATCPIGCHQGYVAPGGAGGGTRSGMSEILGVKKGLA